MKSNILIRLKILIAVLVVLSTASLESRDTIYKSQSKGYYSKGNTFINGKFKVGIDYNYIIENKQPKINLNDYDYITTWTINQDGFDFNIFNFKKSYIGICNNSFLSRFIKLYEFYLSAQLTFFGW